MELSLPVVVAIASVSVFVCVLLIIILCIVLARRHKNNTSRESQSATEPLRKSYITSDLGAPDDICNTSEHYACTSKTMPFNSNKHKRSDSIHYIPIEIAGSSPDCQTASHGLDKADDRSTDGQTQSETNAGKTVADVCMKNMAINPGVEIYNIDPHNVSRVSGLGKYTFKPRLKYMTSKPYHEIEEKDREKLYVINSYKHCAGKSILPSTMTFDKDPEKFSDMFASDLLCSSTPRQGARKEMSRSKGDFCTDLDL